MAHGISVHGISRARAQQTLSMAQFGGSDEGRTDRCREALALWLAWNDRYAQLAQAMYAAAGNQQQIERLSDELDSLRNQAVEASRRALAEFD
jgi:hypothetical protein